MYTVSEENYLKTIFHISGRENRRVSTNDVAEVLQTKASSVTDMIQKLSDKKLIRYEKYKGVSLTPKGRKIAASIVRRHRLWEVFLVDKLNFSWDEIHEIAEELEHIRSEKLVDKLEEYLGFPKKDPHGDPIPDREGKMDHHKDFTLADLAVDEQGIIVGVKEHSSEFLQYLDGVKLVLGARVTIRKVFEYDRTIVAMVGNTELMLSERVGKNIYINRA
ncbi:MAG: metal-dependent transcriptional regulator [Bacteroidia bacterium]|nr:metal-dependent transcriptional regulator [Bacteroidia bacterium]